VAVITGAGVGMGAGIANRFAQAGAAIVINYRSHEEEARIVAAEVEKIGRQVLVVQADVSNSADVARLFEEVRVQMGAVDILVNNSGIYPKSDLLDMSEQDWDETLDINLKGVFLCTQAAARQMIKAGKGGSIVNIGSIEGINPAAGHTHYAASKAGVAMFGMNAALELGKYNIRVNTVSPGLINAPALPTAWPEGLERWLNRCPLGRVGEPEDVADVCLFFASDASRWVTGTQLLVDGGVMTTQIY